MAIENPVSGTPAAPAAAAPAVVAPVVAPAAAAPVVAAVEQPTAPVEAPAAVPSQTPEPAKVEEPAKTDAETPVEAKPADAKTEDAKPEDAKAAAPAEGEKPAEGAKAEEGAAAPVAPAFKLPENVKADAATTTALSNVFGKYGIAPEAQQELVDFHANVMTQAQAQMTAHQTEIWEKTQQDWISDFEKTAGNKRDTVLDQAKFFITETVKDAKIRKEVWGVLAATGAGNNKHIINLLATAGKRMREGKAPAPGAPNNNGKQGTAADRRYGGNTTRNQT